MTIENADLPIIIENEHCSFRLDRITNKEMAGSYLNKIAKHNRLEYYVEFVNGERVSRSLLVEDVTPSDGMDKAHAKFFIKFATPPMQLGFHFHGHQQDDFHIFLDENETDILKRTGEASILFDISDLVYYIGHHDHLTGIQRVQACILLGLIAACPEKERGYISFNNKISDFELLDSEYFESLLNDLSLPKSERRIAFDRDDAKVGVLPHGQRLGPYLDQRSGTSATVYLLGAAWVNKDYFHRISDLKRRHGAKFCMTVHDLIPIYARDTCDQGTAVVFEEFLRKSFYFVDHYFTVSEYTAYDLLRYAKSLGYEELSVSVVENAHTFDEFFPSSNRPAHRPQQGRYAIFVSTIEGRKNHSYIFDVWAQLAKRIQDVPTLICVGRLGWRAESFLEKMLTTANLGGRIQILSDISDAELESLYEGAMFSVYPSVYEGWGLPVGESLAKGKLCISSDKSSIPEVAMDFGIYLDIDSPRDGADKIQRLIEDDGYREELEHRLRTEFKPRTWKAVAQNLVELVESVSRQNTTRFPVLGGRREYKTSQIPPRTYDSLGESMVLRVESARRAFITGRINDDFDLVCSQAVRLGSTWCTPEEWGTWSRFPRTEQLFFINPTPGTRELLLYEKVRVPPPLVGQVLRVTVNSQTMRHFYISQKSFVIRLNGIPVDRVQGTTEVHIVYELLCDKPNVEAELRKIDSRVLGIGFESLLISDDGDFPTRLSILEHLTFGGELAHMLTPSLSAQEAEEARDERKPIYAPWDVRAAMRLVEASGGPLRRSPPLLPLRRLIEFGSLAATPEFGAALSRGWLPPGREGVWTDGVAGEVHFCIESEGAKVLAMCASFRCLAADERPVNVALLHNGTPLGTATITDPDVHELCTLIPISEIPDGRTVDLTLTSSAWYSPSIGNSEGSRQRLGVQLVNLRCDSVPDLELGAPYQVRGESPIARNFISGWYPMEQGGVWSGRVPARILAVIPKTDHLTYIVRLRARVYGTAVTGAAKVEVISAGEVICALTFESDNPEEKSFAISVAPGESYGMLDLSLLRKDAISPSDLDHGKDTRSLGIHISEICVSKVEVIPRPDSEHI